MRDQHKPHFSIELPDAEATRKLGERLATLLRAGDCLTLSGELGAGKTTLVQGLAWGLGLPRTQYAPSPTYNVALTYPTTPLLHHIDLFRVGENAASLLGDAYFSDDAITVIEWPDRAISWLPSVRFEMRLEIAKLDQRRAEIFANQKELMERLFRI